MTDETIRGDEDAVIAFPTPANDKAALEEGSVFSPRFDADGLITAVVNDAGDGKLLMVAHMNAEALSKTLTTGIAHYWSRSRQSLWQKGETSGNRQRVVEMRTDCDQDAVELRVRVEGLAATCHTGRRSCFYRIVAMRNGSAELRHDETKPLFETKKVYGK
ncbi:phosphoribosyl-AMP cyclohydrolase [Notoacmeibacter marinus]|uniref:phosphoribosyl-AMP cyclohydrolase n=1 Tax=Notoacmeibacter marinus TaxID=1876515 RepID=UPI001F0A3C8F|nr:phosphoribosyl-AMP cyclohydrolase [Notoacmeibacter marinus]